MCEEKCECRRRESYINNVSIAHLACLYDMLGADDDDGEVCCKHEAASIIAMCVLAKREASLQTQRVNCLISSLILSLLSASPYKTNVLES